MRAEPGQDEEDPAILRMQQEKGGLEPRVGDDKVHALGRRRRRAVIAREAAHGIHHGPAALTICRALIVSVAAPARSRVCTPTILPWLLSKPTTSR